MTDPFIDFAKANLLQHLRYASAQAVEQFVDSLNELTADDIKSRQLIIALSTGGTIAMKENLDGVRMPDFNFIQMIDFLTPGLKNKFLVKGLDLFNIDSSQMNYHHVQDLVIILCYIAQKIRHDFAGFLVTHGTDTLAFSSAATSLMLGQGLQFNVIFTAAQKPIQDPLSDAATNLRNAIYTIEALEDNDMAEVIVVMGDIALLATSAEKIDDSKENAFTAPLHKFVARFDRLEYPVQLADWLKPKRTKQPFQPTIWQEKYGHTLVIKSMMGLDPDIIRRQVEDERIQAVVFYSYGAGTVYTPLMNEIVKQAKQKEAPVFVVSPVNTEHKALYYSGQELIKLGATPLFMTLSAALPKIEIALRKFPDQPEKISTFMQESYVGEVPSEISRFIS